VIVWRELEGKNVGVVAKNEANAKDEEQKEKQGQGKMVETDVVVAVGSRCSLARDVQDNTNDCQGGIILCEVTPACSTRDESTPLPPHHIRRCAYECVHFLREAAVR
jgi:hypothetical protein